MEKATGLPWEIWTDGSCWPNPGPGGWGFLAKKGSELFLRYAGESGITTNNRMEYIAAIAAIEFLQKGDTAIIYSDSQLLVNTMTTWVHDWIKRGILDQKKNADLVQELLIVSSCREIEWKWVRGHSGVYGNEVANALSEMGRNIIGRGGCGV